MLGGGGPAVLMGQIEDCSMFLNPISIPLRIA